MIDVNTLDLRNEINLINGYICDYEEVQLNMFNELKNACINWQDGHSIEFDEKIVPERVEAYLIIKSLKNKVEVLNFLCEKYSELGNTIKCNLSGKDSLLLNVQDCLNKVNDILSDFNRVDRRFWYSELDNIDSMKSRLINVRARLEECKVSIVKTYNYIGELEGQIKTKVSELEDIKISTFDSNFLVEVQG